MFEDIAAMWTIEIKDKNISFIIGSDEKIIKEICDIRDNPKLKSGKRKSILHAVSKHLRTYQNGNIKKINKHVRGVERFSIDGLDIEICPPITIFAENNTIVENFKGTLQYDVYNAIQKNNINRRLSYEK
jgi:hypothetical protein